MTDSPAARGGPTLPPAISRPPSDDDWPLWWAYTNYAEHYAACPTCQSTDWYEPEPARLCAQGREFWQRWRKLSVATPYWAKRA